MEKRMPLTVRVEVDETGTYVAEVEDLPGCVTQASTFEELLRNLREAITGNLEVRRSMGYEVPSDRRMRLLVDAQV
jgi:predicted RNase H-like HicB family nuclease